MSAGLVKISYTHANLKSASGAAQKANMLAVGYQHNFSRRTALYARIDNSGAQIGVRHRF